MNRYITGVVAGVIATGPMTLVIAAGQRLALLRTPPPTQITTEITNRAGIDPEPPEPGFNAGTLVAHAGFGAVAGGVYVLGRRFLPENPVAAGAIYGGLVWATAYGGYLPVLDIYPAVDDDRPTRTAVMIVAHMVYGISLVEADRRLAARS